MRFCGQCGAALESAPASDAERRQITVMFCDVVGSTTLSETLDPEELRELIQEYQATCADVVARYDGYVAQYLGDGMLVYFGFPRAHEDDARRAVHTALGILADMHGFRATHAGGPGGTLALRIGIHTGTVVAGEVGSGQRRETLALGATPNIAARVQSIADPGTVVVSGATHRLVQSHFTWESLGTRELKGVARPVEVFRAVIERETTDAAALRPRAPLVGREAQTQALTRALDRASTGDAQVVLITGEPGIGKSRLVQQIVDAASVMTTDLFFCRSSAYYTQSAFRTIIDTIKGKFGLDDQTTQADQRAALRRAIATAGLGASGVEADSLLAELLFMAPLDEATAQSSAAQRRAKTIELLADLIVGRAATVTTVFVIEDLHWTDPSTLEVLRAVVSRAESRRLLVVGTSRPTPNVPLSDHPNTVKVSLDRLASQETADLVASLCGGRSLAPDVHAEIARKTDGVPLFIEELTRTLLDAGMLMPSAKSDMLVLSRPLAELAIPDTLNDLLAMRLDDLGDAREIVLAGSVLGREFPYDLLQAVHPRPAQTLDAGIARAVRGEILVELGDTPRRTLGFRHALIRDAAYASLIRQKRESFHARAARAFTDRFPQIAQEQPEVVAYHWSSAGQIREAIPEWLRASQRALMRAANLEAMDHSKHGLALVEKMSPGMDRNRHELSFQITLGAALTAVRGYAADEVEQTYGRARTLSEEVGDTRDLFWTLWGLGVFYLVRARLQTAVENAKRMMRVAETQNDPALMCEAYFARSILQFYLGEFTAARAGFERAIELHAEAGAHSYATITGVDAGVTTRCFLGFTKWMLGLRDEAVTHMREATERANAVRHPYSLAFAHVHHALLHVFRREPAEARALAEQALGLSQEKGFVTFMPLGMFVVGWALAVDRAPEMRAQGIAMLRQAIAIWQGVGAHIWETMFLAHLAEVLSTDGAAELGESEALIEQALTRGRQTGERFWEPALSSLQGVVQGRRASSSLSGAN